MATPTAPRGMIAVVNKNPRRVKAEVMPSHGRCRHMNDATAKSTELDKVRNVQ